MEECNHDCAGCSRSCSERQSQQNLKEVPHKLSHVKKLIGIVSGKGGVGKSLVTSLLACAVQASGRQAGILDADITGPSIPKAFGVHERARGNENMIYPVKSAKGIDIMSVNLLLDSETDPVLWRGTLLSGAVKQFWTDVVWENEDYLFIDMPPGTGDVPLTVFQSLPVDGIIIVTSPQELVSMIVAKAVKMAEMMEIPILGLVENMSYFRCPDNGIDYKIFGESHIEEVAESYGLKVLARMPVNPGIAEACDMGRIEEIPENPLKELAEGLDAILEK